MADMLVEVGVPYKVVFREYRGRTDRETSLLAKGKVSIAVPSVEEAPAAFRIHPDGGLPFEVRFFADDFWWPLIERKDVPEDADTFVAELASGAYRSVCLLDPTLLWYGGQRGTIEDFFARHPRAKIASSNHDERYHEIQRGALDIMLCGDKLYFRGSAPAFFGVRADAATKGPISLRAGSPPTEKNFLIAGASYAERSLATRRGEVFHPHYIADEAETFCSAIKTTDKIEQLTPAPACDAPDFYLDVALRAVFYGSSTALMDYGAQLPKEWLHDATFRVPVELGHKILQDILAGEWKLKDPRLAEPIARAEHFLNRLRPDFKIPLAPVDEEAIALLALLR